MPPDSGQPSRTILPPIVWEIPRERFVFGSAHGALCELAAGVAGHDPLVALAIAYQQAYDGLATSASQRHGQFR